MEKWAGPIALLTVTAIVVYLIYKATHKVSNDPLGSIIDGVSNAGSYEFDSESGDPNDPGDVFIPTM